MNGVLILDKPAGLSSATAVERVKRAVGAKRAGHGGTLDPLATGVLPVCLDAATKLAQYLLADDKEYEATGVLGVETDTLDRTGRVTCERPVDVTVAALRAVLAARMGEQAQVPPMFSAIRQGGVRLYHRARAGEHVERAPRPIRIDRFELLAFEPPRFRVAITCSKGTYVRSLVADVGADLGCGAHLAELRRTRSGRFAIADAVTLDALSGPAGLDLASRLVPLAQATNLPSVVAKTDQLQRIRDGLQLPVTDFTARGHERFQLVDERGRLVAISHVELGKVIYDRVFPDDATS